MPTFLLVIYSDDATLYRPSSSCTLYLRKTALLLWASGMHGPDRIAVGSLEHRSDRPVIGGDPRTRTWLGDGDRDLLSLEREQRLHAIQLSMGWVDP